MTSEETSLEGQSSDQGDEISSASQMEDYLDAGTSFMPSSSAPYVAYTVKLPAEQLAALQSIWLELKKLYGTHSPDKSGMIQLAISEWLKRWESPDRQSLLRELLQIREDTRRRQYRKML